MNREIKYRGWYMNGQKCTMITFGIEGVPKDLELKLDYTTVQQFTGLKDKNGVDVYEGDVLLYNDTENISVWYQDSLGCFLAGTKEYDNTLYFYSPTVNCKVIGNIYEHPHLIK